MLMGVAFCNEMARQRSAMAALFSMNMARPFSVLSEEKRCMKDHNRRLLAAKYEVKRNLYKALLRDPNTPYDFREKTRLKLAKLPRNSAFSRIRNRCIFTVGLVGFTSSSVCLVICFRDLASKGALMGVKKASW